MDDEGFDPFKFGFSIQFGLNEVLDPDYGKLAMVYSTNKFLGYKENGEVNIEKIRLISTSEFVTRHLVTQNLTVNAVYSFIARIWVA